MKVSIVDASGQRHRARVAENGEFATIAACPSCGAAPCEVQGTGITHHNYDTYFAPAVARCCGNGIGTIEAKVDTFFGIEEDEAVLRHGRARVYGGET
jgi:hypothetical protein